MQKSYKSIWIYIRQWKYALKNKRMKTSAFFKWCNNMVLLFLRYVTINFVLIWCNIMRCSIAAYNDYEQHIRILASHMICIIISTWFVYLTVRSCAHQCYRELLTRSKWEFNFSERRVILELWFIRFCRYWILQSKALVVFKNKLLLIISLR